MYRMTEKHQHLECPNCGEPFVSAFKKEEGSLLYCCVCTPRLREVNWQRQESVKVRWDTSWAVRYE